MLFCETKFHKIIFTYLAPKKVVRFSEVTDAGFDMLSFPKESSLLQKKQVCKQMKLFHILIYILKTIPKVSNFIIIFFFFYK